MPMNDEEAMKFVLKHCPGLPVAAAVGGSPTLLVHKGTPDDKPDFERFPGKTWKEAADAVIEKYGAKKLPIRPPVKPNRRQRRAQQALKRRSKR